MRIDHIAAPARSPSVAGRISGVGFAPSFVVVMSEATHHARLRLITMPGTLSCTFDSVCSNPQITSLDPDGFTVGTELSVNEAGSKNHWFAIRSLPGAVATNQYLGDGDGGRAPLRTR